MLQEVDQDPQVDDALRVAVDRRVEEGAVAVDLAGGPGERTIEDIEEARHGQHQAAQQQLVDRDQERPKARDDQAEQREHVGGDR